MKKENLKELKKLLKEIIDESGSRENVEELLKKRKPNFVLSIKSNEDGESSKVHIEGSSSDIMFGLSNLIAAIVEGTNLDEDDIRDCVNVACKALKDKKED